ncbi:hypothetical protein SAY86_022629 [Trapa natans]|uniref:Uncharacterized protein n=1 Tax=Trapa natans TaxID=22666 RepID=A0AAN7LVY3_TRANT|nr:hypothetical protein SAY86_022629 [Trapa natans]
MFYLIFLFLSPSRGPTSHIAMSQGSLRRTSKHFLSGICFLRTSDLMFETTSNLDDGSTFVREVWWKRLKDSLLGLQICMPNLKWSLKCASAFPCIGPPNGLQFR